MKIIIVGFICSLLNVGDLNAQVNADSLELVKLYNATNGEQWINTWDLQSPVSEWYGVEVFEGKVIGVILSGNNLVGHIPDLNLDMLRTLELLNNNLMDTIPNFTSLPNLSALYLSHNDLTGKIPNFTSLKLLRVFHVHNNLLEGRLPNFEFCKELNNIVCSENSLTGRIPSFLHLENLFLLNVHFNFLSGPFPSQFPPRLEVLNCNDNLLSGSLPNFFNAPNIKVFNCSYNRLTGEIPKYKNLTNFELFLCNVNELTGGIPEFENLPKLNRFECSENYLSGELPSFLGVKSIENFYCDGNNLTGSIPDYSYLAVLNLFHCHNNQLTGVIPDFSEWNNLSSLLIQNNQLHGGIPADAPPSLNQLKCSENNLSGCFPDYACQLLTFESENNLLMPWFGNHEQFCLGESQTGAPCNDGNPDTIDDTIFEDCGCNDLSLSLNTQQIQNSVIIFPNPVSEELFIETDFTDDFVVQISDVTGTIVFENFNVKNIDTSDLMPGLYFMSLRQNNREAIFTEKFIVR